MAIRWASDRIKEQGVIAFVTNGSWIDANVDAGIRACVAEEFNSVYVLHLRGNTRTQGERARREGGQVFGSGSRAPVAITILVKNPNVIHNKCCIHFRDIGDYLKREKKMAVLREAVSISGFGDWREITPDKHYDWIGQRSDTFSQFYPLGSKDAKAGRTDDTIFRLYSQGLKTNRDAYLYNFSRNTCAENARKMTDDYLAALSEIKANSEFTEEVAAYCHAKNLKWDRELMNKLKRKKKIKFENRYIRKAAYRPFVPTNCYADYTFANCKYQIDRIFPHSLSENRIICVPGIGANKLFSVLMADTMPDLELISKSQCFPRYYYPKPVELSDAQQTRASGELKMNSRSC